MDWSFVAPVPRNAQPTVSWWVRPANAEIEDAEQVEAQVEGDLLRLSPLSPPVPGESYQLFRWEREEIPWETEGLPLEQLGVPIAAFTVSDQTAEPVSPPELLGVETTSHFVFPGDSCSESADSFTMARVNVRAQPAASLYLLRAVDSDAVERVVYPAASTLERPFVSFTTSEREGGVREYRVEAFDFAGRPATTDLMVDFGLSGGCSSSGSPHPAHVLLVVLVLAARRRQRS